MPFHALTVWGPLYENIVDAAYLHDVIEDCGVTKEDIKAEGFTPLTAEIVEVVSRKKDENYLDFVVRIMNSGSISVGAIAVKLADLQHNMSDLNEGSLKDKYRLAQYILMQRIRRVN
jgi:(p)ppGpp synthase/HD superfamily hydrolase